jgi:glutathione peroxidase
MKKMMLYLPLVAIMILAGIYAFSSASPVSPAAASKDFYSLEVEGIDGDVIRMSDFKGKYVLCVNVASKCGYTSQYADLQKLYEANMDQLVIIGFPCNQFLGQEPGSNDEIASFCQKNYGVTFPLTAKIKVKGSDQHPVYQWLTNQELDGESNHSVKWNFHKFLVGPEGRLIRSFPSKVNPLDEELTQMLASK